ncbi:MAG TPA: hypothetical protein VJ327_01860 [Patescibacteria group bacterium]|nr:MAG: hypothetical protein UX14_C0023G0001 [Parcubacteria group bacterium GW2011_GWF1_45_5]HJZ04591.1 hypothetical protein [Patescibacteria group bacterium]
MSDRSITAEFQENYRYAHDYWAPFIQDAKVYTLAASGYTWSDTERRELIKEGREPIELNIMRRPLQFFSGYLRDNINSVIYAPVEGSDQKTADQLTKIGYYVWDKGSGYPEFLDACDESFKSGISLCGIRMDYSKDFVNGDIKFFKRTYNSFYLDPTFEHLDLVDCAYSITRDLISRDYAKQLLPDVDPSEIDAIAVGFRDDKFLSYHPNFTTFSRNRNLLAYDQYYRRTTRERQFLVDVDTGFYRDITDLPSDEKKRLKVGMKRLRDDRSDSEVMGLDMAQMPNVEVRTVSRPYVEMHVMLNGQHVFTGEDTTGIVETYPFVPCICYMEPSIWMPSQRIQGMASCQWSAQRQFNKRHMKIIDMMDSTISTGYKYLIGSVPDPTDMQQSGQNRLIGIDADPEKAPQGLESVQQLQGGGANPALIEYQKVLDDLTLTLGNVTQASLGMDEKRNTLLSGRLAQVQIAQNLMSNRKVFDNIDQSQQILGSLVLTCIQNHYPRGKVNRILNEEPTEQFYEQQFEQYDAVIKEGVRSKSQKDAYYYELVNLKRDGIVDVPQSEIIRALQMSGMSDLQAAIEEQEKKVAEQQKKIDEQERMAMELANAQKEQMTSLAQERRARVIADVGLAAERASEAQENMAQAALARAKTITEIASMEDERILRVLEFVNSLEQQEIMSREKVSAQIESTSDQINSETQGSSENQTLQAAQQQINQEVLNAL